MSKAPNDKRSLPFGGSMAINDQSVLDFLHNLNLDVLAILNDSEINYKFCHRYLEWLGSSKINTIKGLENFPEICYTNGTTEAFDHFYAKNKNRRFRCFRGEYVYHSLSWRNNFPGWSFIEDDELDSNDAVVLSWPFSNTGTEHDLARVILEKCCDLNIPVLIDCIYYTVGSSSIDLNYDCITDVVFGLSKTFPVAHARIGIRLTRVDNDDPLLVLKKINYNNRISARIGLELINNYGPDYIFEKYRDKQIAICEFLKVEPSNAVLFGLGGEEWKIYNRGSTVNRLSFHNFLHRPLEDIYNASVIN